MDREVLDAHRRSPAKPAVWLAVALLLIPAAGWGAEQNPSGVVRQAAKLLQSGQVEQARVELHRVVGEFPGFYPAYSLLGVCYSHLGKLEEARPYFEKAVQLAPESPQARNNLGANYLALGKATEAIEQFEKVIAAAPSNTSAWVNLANGHLKLGDTSRALEVLEKAVALAPGDTGVRLALAEVRLDLAQPEAALKQIDLLDRPPMASDPRFLLTVGVLLAKYDQNQQAARYLKRARDADPNGSASMVALGRKSINNGDYKTAWALLKSVEGAYRKSAQWHSMVGYAAYKLDQAEPALEHLQKAVHLDPKNENYYLDLAEFLGNNNALDAVVALLEGGVKIVPQSVKVQSALAVAYLLIRDFAKAETLLQKVLLTDPAYKVGHKLLADCYYRAQEWRKLKTAAGALRRLDKKNSIGWYYGAEAEYRLLRAEKGQSSEFLQGYLQEAIKLDPDDWRAQLLSGKVLLEQGRHGDAVAAIRRAAARNPDEPSAHYLLATTLRQLGKIEESKSAFETFKQAQENEKKRQLRRLLVEIR